MMRSNPDLQVESLSRSEHSLTVTVPLTIRLRGGRKLLLAPEGTKVPLPRPLKVHSALLKALARGFRWRRLLDIGVYATADDLARAEQITPSYVFRLLRLTFLPPPVVEAIVDGRQPPDWTVAVLERRVALEWPSVRERTAA